MKKYSDVLRSCHLQLAFKGHFTIMCTAILKETISHNMKHNSKVYVFLLDASKAFDRVEYGKLFQLLLGRKLPTLIIRSILDGYTRLNICTMKLS